jgi:hypothetical protein
LRRILTTLAVSAAALALPSAALAQSPTTFTAQLQEANDSGASGTATIQLDGTTADIRIQGRNFFDGFPHAIHIHGEPGGSNVCPPAMNPGEAGFDDVDENGDGILSVVEGVPFYGGVTVSLTTEGDTSPDSALAVDRFPTSGTLDYQRTIELPQDVADNLSSLHVVVHATDINDSGEIGDSGTESSLDPELDIEATAPAACGQLVASAAGGVDTGAGGTATTTDSGVLLAGLAGLGLLGAAATRRRVRERA